eukprot:UN25697
MTPSYEEAHKSDVATSPESQTSNSGKRKRLVELEEKFKADHAPVPESYELPVLEDHFSKPLEAQNSIYLGEGAFGLVKQGISRNKSLVAMKFPVEMQSNRWNKYAVRDFCQD